ncbi:MAG: NUDIX hydrolase [Cyclobacteriaceae bacterium]|nr:NUDIX hydrolase [Cyclobacteriaceae bacterium]
MNRKVLIQLLENYLSPFQEEQLFKRHFLELLKDANAFQRTHLPGHITGSAWVVNADANKTLLVHHAKLNKWVQPGGHADGDENVLAVAKREAEEETGLMNFKIDGSIFDIDIHTIPARKDFPQHQHYDIRFLFRADEYEPIIISEESHDVKWIPIDQLTNYTTERSVLRMSEKLA